MAISRLTADGLVGRVAELAEIERLLDLAAGSAGALVLEGDPGIGKTTLWRAGVERARALGFRVLAPGPPRPSGSSRSRGSPTSSPALPTGSTRCRRRSAARCGWRSCWTMQAPRWSTTGRSAAAVLGLLRAVAAEGPVLVAVDDTQWLDPPSQLAIEFAVRRLDGDRVGVLAAHRRTEPSRLVLEDAERLRVGPLTLAATHELLRRRLGRTFPRPTLVRLQETANGNPFFAIELARALGDRQPAADEPLPVPGTLRELVVNRFERLPPQARETTLFVAALGRPTASALAAAVGDGDRVAIDLEERGRGRGARPRRRSDPLHAPAARVRPLRRGDAGRAPRRAPAAVGGRRDPEERARHLAAAAEARTRPSPPRSTSCRAGGPHARRAGRRASWPRRPPGSRRPRPRTTRAAAASPPPTTTSSPARPCTLTSCSSRRLETRRRGPERARVAIQLASQLDQDQIERARDTARQRPARGRGRPAAAGRDPDRHGVDVQQRVAGRRPDRRARVAVELAERIGDPALLAAALTLAAGATSRAARDRPRAMRARARARGAAPRACARAAAGHAVRVDAQVVRATSIARGRCTSGCAARAAAGRRGDRAMILVQQSRSTS